MSLLTQERLKELLHYNPDTGIFTRIATPGKRSDLLGKEPGHTTYQGYIIICVDDQKYRAHRLAWLYIYGEFPKKFIDHKNRTKDDNRIVNLRLCNKSQNSQNTGVRQNNTSGVTGVYWNKAANKWQSYIKIAGKCKYLGIFSDMGEAISARRSAESKYFGEFSS